MPDTADVSTAAERKTILLVEDEAIIAMVEAQGLQSLGYKVLTASRGEKAVEIALTNDEISLILMDIELGGGMDGTEAARRILKERNIPIVFLTSHSERDMVEKVRDITRYGYVIKSTGNFVLQSSVEMAYDLFTANERMRRELESKNRSVR